MVSVPCEKRGRLIVAYVAAVENYRNEGERRTIQVVKVLTWGQREGLEKLEWERCEAARIALEEHIAEHGC
jgi:hypothetical protein